MSRELDLPRRKPGSANSYLNPAAWHLAISPAILRVNRGATGVCSPRNLRSAGRSGHGHPRPCPTTLARYLLMEEPLRDEIKTTAGWFLDRHKGKESIPAI